MPETAEQTRYLLLDTIINLLNGKADDGKLREALAKSRQSLFIIQKDLENQISNLDNRIREGAADEIQMVYKFFGDWENAFHAVERYFTTHQKFDLVSAGEMVKNSSEGLNFALDNYVARVLTVMGPTDIPKLNQLIEAVREVKEDHVPVDKLKKIAGDEWMIAEGAKKELEFELKHFQSMEHALLAQAYGDLQKAIEQLGAFVRDNKYDMFDQALDECRAVYTRIKELIPQVNLQRMSMTPTKSPAANLLINTVLSYMKGGIPEAMFINALKEAEDDFNLTRAKIQALTRQETDNADIAGELEKTQEGIDLYQDALNDLRGFLESREGFLLEQARKDLQSSADILYKSMQFFEALADREGKTPCIRCGTYNQPERKTCEKCGAILPKTADATAGSTFEVQVGEQSYNLNTEEEVLPENLERMFLAVNQVAEDEISLEEFEDVIEWLQGVMEQNQAGGFAPLPQMDTGKMTAEEKEEADKLMSDLEQAKELFEEGYRDWEEGLDYFREYIDVLDKNLLIQGVQVMWEGNKKLNQMKKIVQKLPQNVPTGA